MKRPITPPPWTAAHDDASCWIEAQDGDMRVTVASDVSENDVGLIAAAPELLAALIEVGKCATCNGAGHYFVGGETTSERLECAACKQSGYRLVALAAMKKAWWSK